MPSRTQACGCIALGLAAALCAVWLAILAPKPRPGEFNTITHKPFVAEVRR